MSIIDRLNLDLSTLKTYKMLEEAFPGPERFFVEAENSLQNAIDRGVHLVDNEVTFFGGKPL